MENVIVSIGIVVCLVVFTIYKSLRGKIKNLEENIRELADKKKLLIYGGAIAELVKVKIYKNSNDEVVKEEYFDVSDNCTEIYEYLYNSNGIKVETKWFRWWIDEESGKKYGQRSESVYNVNEKIETEIEYEELEGNDIDFKSITYYDNSGQIEKEDVYNSEKIRHTNRYRYDQFGRIQSTETEFYYTTDELTGKNIHKLEATTDQKPKERIERTILKYDGDSKLPVEKRVISEVGTLYDIISYSYDDQGRKITETNFNTCTFYYYEDNNHRPYLELSVEHPKNIHAISTYKKCIIVRCFNIEVV